MHARLLVLLLAMGACAHQGPRGPAGYVDQQTPGVRLILATDAERYHLVREPIDVELRPNEVEPSHVVREFLAEAVRRGAHWAGELELKTYATVDGGGRQCVARIVPTFRANAQGAEWWDIDELPPVCKATDLDAPGLKPTASGVLWRAPTPPP